MMKDTTHTSQQMQTKILKKQNRWEKKLIHTITEKPHLMLFLLCGFVYYGVLPLERCGQAL